MPSLFFRGAPIPIPDYRGFPPVKGYVYVCPHCGESWGIFHASAVGSYIITAMPCPEHGASSPSHRVGGSFRYPFRWRDNYAPAEGVSWESYPIGLLRHEALMLSKHILK